MIYLGGTPALETNVPQAGSSMSNPVAWLWLAQIRRRAQLAKIDVESAELTVSAQHHDFGTYYEVTASENDAGMEIDELISEDAGCHSWDAEAKEQLRELQWNIEEPDTSEALGRERFGID